MQGTARDQNKHPFSVQSCHSAVFLKHAVTLKCKMPFIVIIEILKTIVFLQIVLLKIILMHGM